MTLGDGIRRNIATVSKEERSLFIDAIKQLNHFYYTGSRTDFPAGHVSYWFKQDEIHQSSHVHGCAEFLPWHRELCNRFEALLRSVHPELSLHYWDWNFDPSNMADGNGQTVNLFDKKGDFMGNADGNINGGSVGEPLLSAGFYLLNPSDPDPNDGKFRADEPDIIKLNRPDPNNPSTWSYPTKFPDNTPLHYNPADPPKTLTRGIQAGAPPVGSSSMGFYWPTDDELINAPTWESFNDLMQGVEIPTPSGQPQSNNGAHAGAHSYIGGNLSNPHLSFRDPFVFLLHSNVDRLWAMWQQKSPTIRLDPEQVYGTQGNTTGTGDVEVDEQGLWGILSPLEPWASLAAQTLATGIVKNVHPVHPWFAAPEIKNSKHPSVVTPPRYDTAI
jgi:tyrosinase-like protein